MNVIDDFQKWLSTQSMEKLNKMDTTKIFTKFVNDFLRQPGNYSKISNIIWEHEKSATKKQLT